MSSFKHKSIICDKRVIELKPINIMRLRSIKDDGYLYYTDLNKVANFFNEFVNQKSIYESHNEKFTELVGKLCCNPNIYELKGIGVLNVNQITLEGGKSFKACTVNLIYHDIAIITMTQDSFSYKLFC